MRGFKLEVSAVPSIIPFLSLSLTAWKHAYAPVNHGITGCAFLIRLLLNLHNTGEHNQVQHDLLGPGEPLGAADVTEVDG